LAKKRPGVNHGFPDRIAGELSSSYVRGCFFVLLLALLTVSSNAYPCSIFMVTEAGEVLVGNNEDYYLDVTPRIWITPGEPGEHGRVCFGFDRRFSRPFAQGGMNTAGLFFDVAVTPPGPEPKADLPEPPRNMGDRLLAECATVEEAVAWLAKYRLTLLKASHMLLADATGDSAVVELVAGEMQVLRDRPPFRAITNFSLKQPELGNHPCPRFTLMEQALGSRTGPIHPEGAARLLQAVAVPKTPMEEEERDGGTLYSNVYDLKRRVIHVYARGDFTKRLVLDVGAMLAKGSGTHSLDALIAERGEAVSVQSSRPPDPS